MPEIKKIKNGASTVEELLNTVRFSDHLFKERLCRLNHLEGTSIVAVFEVQDSTKCKYGPVLHCITDKAEDLIMSAVENKIITVLICRPNQIRWLYKGTGQEVPQQLRIAALVNELCGRNI